MISGSSISRRRVVAALLLCTAGIYPARAAESTPVPEWGVEQLMLSLAQVKTAKAKFSERKYLTILNAPLEFSGTLVYTAPGRLEKYTQLPKPEVLVLDQDKLTIESSERNQRRTLTLQDYPVVWAFVESIRSTLAGDLKTLNRFYRATLEGTEAQWRLSLQPRTSQMQTIVREIKISGSKNQIRAIEINETEGNRSVMTISEDAP